MQPTEPSDSDRLSRAIMLYVGYSRSFPKVSAQPVLEQFGDAGPPLVDYAKDVVTETNAITVDWSQHDLSSAGDEVEAVIARRHPELTAEALNALSWTWTFDWR